MSRFYYECRRIARDASPEMMRGLIELARTAQDERVKSVALVAVLDRAGIRPIDYDPNEQFNRYDNMSLEEKRARLAELAVRVQDLLQRLETRAMPADGAQVATENDESTTT